MTSEIETLRKSDLFIILEDAELKKIYEIMEKRNTHEGEKLAISGENARFFFFLISGTLLLSMEKGKSAVFDDPGDFIGLEILSSKGIYKNALTALTKGEVFAVNRNAFLNIIFENTPVSRHIIHAWNNYRLRKIPFAGQRDFFTTGYQY